MGADAADQELIGGNDDLALGVAFMPEPPPVPLAAATALRGRRAFLTWCYAIRR
jgi:hypothetical protein